MIAINPIYLYMQLYPGQLLTAVCIDHPKSKRSRRTDTGQSRSKCLFLSVASAQMSQ
jgi:hypothetical protein